jgi:hypothetical protein
MAILIKNIREGHEYEGFELEYVIDEDVKLGEVYLDEDLVFQSDDVFTEKQLKQDFNRHFKVSHIHDSIVGQELSSIDYNIEGVSTGLFTPGGEYSTVKGTEYVGDYHIHPDGIVMQGKFHDPEESARSLQNSILEPMEDEDIVDARLQGTTHNIDYTIDEDVYPWIHNSKDPMDLTDDEMLDEQRKEANKLRFGIDEIENDDESEY